MSSATKKKSSKRGKSKTSKQDSKLEQQPQENEDVLKYKLKSQDSKREKSKAKETKKQKVFQSSQNIEEEQSPEEIEKELEIKRRKEYLQQQLKLIQQEEMERKKKEQQLILQKQQEEEQLAQQKKRENEKIMQQIVQIKQQMKESQFYLMSEKQITNILNNLSQFQKSFSNGKFKEMKFEKLEKERDKQIILLGGMQKLADLFLQQVYSTNKKINFKECAIQEYIKWLQQPSSKKLKKKLSIQASLDQEFREEEQDGKDSSKKFNDQSKIKELSSVPIYNLQYFDNSVDKFAKLDQAKQISHSKIKGTSKEIQSVLGQIKQIKQENQNIQTRNTLQNEKNASNGGSCNINALKELYDNEIKIVKQKIVSEQNKNRLHIQKLQEGDQNEERLQQKSEKLNEMIDSLEQNMQKFGDNQKIFNNYYKIRDQKEQIKKIQMEIKNNQKNYEKQFEKKSKTLKFNQKNLQEVQKNIDDKVAEINQFIQFMKEVSFDPFNYQNALKERSQRYFVANNHGFDYHLIPHLMPELFETQNYTDSNNMLNETFFVPQIGNKPRYIRGPSPEKENDDQKKKKKRQSNQIQNKGFSKQFTYSEYNQKSQAINNVFNNSNIKKDNFNTQNNMTKSTQNNGNSQTPRLNSIIKNNNQNLTNSNISAITGNNQVLNTLNNINTDMINNNTNKTNILNSNNTNTCDDKNRNLSSYIDMNDNINSSDNTDKITSDNKSSNIVNHLIKYITNNDKFIKNNQDSENFNNNYGNFQSQRSKKLSEQFETTPTSQQSTQQSQSEQMRIKNQRNFIQRNLTKAPIQQGISRLQNIDNAKAIKSTSNSANHSSNYYNNNNTNGNNMQLSDLQNINIQFSNIQLTAVNNYNINNTTASSVTSNNQNQMPTNQVVCLPSITSGKVNTNTSYLEDIQNLINDIDVNKFGKEQNRKLLPAMSQEDTLKSNKINNYELKDSIKKKLLRNLSSNSPPPNKRNSLEMTKQIQGFDQQGVCDSTISKIQENFLINNLENAQSQQIFDKLNIELEMKIKNTSNQNIFETERLLIKTSSQKKQRINKSLNLGKIQNEVLQNCNQQNINQNSPLDISNLQVNKSNIGQLEQYIKEMKPISQLCATENIRQGENKKGKLILDKLTKQVDISQSLIPQDQGKEKNSNSVNKRIEQSRQQIQKINQNDSVMLKQIYNSSQNNQQIISDQKINNSLLTEQSKLNNKTKLNKELIQKQIAESNNVPATLMAQIQNLNLIEGRDEIIGQDIYLSPLGNSIKQIQSQNQQNQKIEFELQQQKLLSNKEEQCLPYQQQNIQGHLKTEQLDIKENSQQKQEQNQKFVSSNYIKLVCNNMLLYNNEPNRNVKSISVSNPSNPPIQNKQSNSQYQILEKMKGDSSENVIFPPSAATYTNKNLFSRRSRSVFNKEEETDQKLVSNSKKMLNNSDVKKKNYQLDNNIFESNQS